MRKDYIYPETPEFQNDYANMYPEAAIKLAQYPRKDERFSMATKNVTIVVTEDCTLRCSYCFAAGTPIRMADGTEKPIEDVQVGDQVEAVEEDCPGEETLRDKVTATVEQVFQREAALRSLVLKVGRDLKVTGNHPILAWDPVIDSPMWYEAQQIQPGWILNPAMAESVTGLDKVAVASNTEIEGEAPVYNLGTSAKTYIANGIAVHNCYQHNKNSCHVMRKETARKIVDMLFEEDAKENAYLNEYIAQAVILDFIGGEPTLEIELIEYFMRCFLWKAISLNHRWALHYMISISSNGTLYFTPAMQRFMTLFNGRVSLTLTLDGNKELHDACRRYPDGRPSYNIVAKATAHCQRVFGQATDTELTIAPANVMYLAEAVKNLHDNFDFHGVHANCVYEEGWKIEHAKILFEQMRKIADWMIEKDIQRHFYCTLFDQTIGRPMPESENQNWCGGTGSMLCFTTEGDITPCLRYTHFNLNDKQPEIRIGSLREGLAQKPKHRAIMAELDSITRQSQSEQKCLDCPIARGCSWCSAYNYEVYGTPNKRATFICPMHIARVLGNVYYWNKLYRRYGDADRFPMHVPYDWAVEIVSEAEFQALTALAAADACRPAML